MIDVIRSLGAWSWIILGGILLAVELIAPGTFVLWLGVSAILVGLISFVIDWNWQEQGVGFVILAVASLVMWWRLIRPARRDEDASDQPFLNRRAQGFVGREFTLEKPIVDGAGTVRIDDTIWRVAGPDTPAGTRVRVVEAKGANLTVAAA
jgi:inner membrane protein